MERTSLSLPAGEEVDAPTAQRERFERIGLGLTGPLPETGTMLGICRPKIGVQLHDATRRRDHELDERWSQESRPLAG